MDICIEKEITKNSLETVKVNGMYLHSKYNPINEAERFLENEYKPHHLHIVFGYGLGYVVDTLIEKTHFNEPILVLDPLIDNQQLNMTNTTYKRLYNENLDKTVEVINKIDQLSSYSTNVHVIISMNYDKLFPEQLKKVLDLVKNNHYKQGSNMATAKHFAVAWQKNFLYNTPNLVTDSSLKILKGMYAAPIIIAAGGPSLTKQLPLLSQVRDKVILICAGSTINTLLTHDIMPDYIVSVDGGEPNAQHFEQLMFDSRVSLIYGPTNHDTVRKAFSGNCYGFIPSVKPKYAQYFSERFSKNLPLIDGGGSVAHYSLSIARYITSGPIALIGQDLALTNNQTHADGNRRSESAEQIPENKKLLVEGYYSEKVVTTESMNIMINSFNEPPLINIDRQNIWNCTEGGAKIKSIAQMPFIQFINDFTLGKINKLEPNEEKEFNLPIENFLKNETENYYRVKKILNKGTDLIKNSVGIALTQDELNKISKIEKNLNKLYKQFSMETLFDPIFDRCSQEYLPQIAETEMQAKIRAKNYALDLFESCFQQIDSFIHQANIREKN